MEVAALNCTFISVFRILHLVRKLKALSDWKVITSDDIRFVNHRNTHNGVKIFNTQHLISSVSYSKEK